MGDWRCTSGELPEPVSVLIRALSQANSAWTLDFLEDDLFLTRRVPTAESNTYDEALSHGGRAAKLLGAAWRAAFARDHSASQAYRDAVRAVEVVAIPVVIPKDPMPTLGKVITAMHDAPQKWTVVLKPVDGKGVDRVRELLELLWTASCP